MGSRRGSGDHQGACDARIGRQKSGTQPTRVIVAAGVDEIIKDTSHRPRLDALGRVPSALDQTWIRKERRALEHRAFNWTHILLL
jgi:hypothetical protein